MNIRYIIEVDFTAIMIITITITTYVLSDTCSEKLILFHGGPQWTANKKCKTKTGIRKRTEWGKRIIGY